MIPVTQTRTHPPGTDPTTLPVEERGNCWASCIASLLELPLEEVDAGIRLDDEWLDRTMAWLRSKGYDLAWHGSPWHAPLGWSIVTGRSPRGIAHACVAHNGRIVHDPHPDRTGLETVNDWWALVQVQHVDPRLVAGAPQLVPA